MIEDQPAPIAQPTKVPVWDLVAEDARRMFTRDDDNIPPRGTVDVISRLMIVDMSDRDKLGRERYGTPLTTHNGRDHLVDAYQEMLDGCVYMRAEIEEKGANYVAVGVHSIYVQHLINACKLRHMLWERDGK